MPNWPTYWEKAKRRANMASKPRPGSARALFAALQASTAQLYADEEWDAFHARQQALWDAIQARRRVEVIVLRLLREAMPPLPPELTNGL